MGGHLGIKKTIARIRERFYFPKMNATVTKYINSCHTCQTRKALLLAPARLLEPIKVGGVCEAFGIDLITHLQVSQLGNKAIIVATEYPTKYAIVRAVPAGTAAFVAMFIVENVVCQFG